MRARADLKEIVRYTFQTWGIEQARRYNASLLKCFHLIAESPAIGRTCNHVRGGYRRIEHGQHVVFYTVDPKAVVIGRILHRSMLPEMHAME